MYYMAGMALTALAAVSDLAAPRLKHVVIAIASVLRFPFAMPPRIPNGDIDHIVPLILAAVCAGVAYLLVTLSVVILRIRRPDLPFCAYRAPVGFTYLRLFRAWVLLSPLLISPRGMSSRDVPAFRYYAWIDCRLCLILDIMCAAG